MALMKHPSPAQPTKRTLPANDVSPVAHEIRRRMAARGMTPKALSRRAGVGPTYLYDLLAGRSHSPVLDKLRKIAAALDCDMEDLVHPVTGNHSGEPEGMYAVETPSILPLRPSEFALISVWRILPRRAKDAVMDYMTRLIPGPSGGGGGGGGEGVDVE